MRIEARSKSMFAVAFFEAHQAGYGIGASVFFGAIAIVLPLIISIARGQQKNDVDRD